MHVNKCVVDESSAGVEDKRKGICCVGACCLVGRKERVIDVFICIILA